MVDVSILMPTKDRPDRLARAVAAILAQEGPTFELILNNGGGPIPDFADERVTVINRSTPLNMVLNQMAERATGRLMHVSCDDDQMLPGTLADAVEKTVDWCYGRMQFFQDGVPGAVIGAYQWSAHTQERHNTILAPTAFWTRQLFDKAGGFDESLHFVWDYELWSRFGSMAEPTVRTHVDYLYELWSGSISSNHAPEIDAEVHKLQDRWRARGFGERP